MVVKSIHLAGIEGESYIATIEGLNNFNIGLKQLQADDGA
jgi:hypothetical protein